MAKLIGTPQKTVGVGMASAETPGDLGVVDALGLTDLFAPPEKPSTLMKQDERDNVEISPDFSHLFVICLHGADNGR